MAAQSHPTPGYFDLQVNGYAGIDFNTDTLTPDDLHTACARLRDHGTDACLATIITDHVDVMARRLRRLVELRGRDELAQQVIAGLHIEGPFISPVDGYRGAHPRDAVIPADVDIMQRLLNAADGLARLVTLAPEHDAGFRTTRHLADAGIAVAAGHTDASLDQLRGAIDAGLSLFTHLGNGCPMQMHRHDNIVQRALSLADRLWCCFIADGAHVAFPALGNYLRLAGDRAVIVTDAMAAAGMNPGRYRIGRWDVLVGEDMVARAADGSHLIGAAITMPQTADNLARHLGLGAERIDQLLRHNPRRAIGLPP